MLQRSKTWEIMLNRLATLREERIVVWLGSLGTRALHRRLTSHRPVLRDTSQWEAIVRNHQTVEPTGII
eukprot:4519749-Pleurochrysis_carterae.AAC.1